MQRFSVRCQATRQPTRARATNTTVPAQPGGADRRLFFLLHLLTWIGVDKGVHHLGQAFALVLLEKVPTIFDGGMRLILAAGYQRLKALVTARSHGSESLNAVRNGFRHCFKTSQAARLLADAGLSGDAGTRVGNWRAPALKDSSG